MRYIYEIKNLINEKTYYGQRTLPTDKKRTPLGDNYFGSGKILNMATKKYGKENFKKSIIIQGDFSKEELNKFEKCIIRMMRSIGKAEYNIADGGDGGKTHTKETMTKEGYEKCLSKILDPTIRKKSRDTLRERIALGLIQHRDVAGEKNPMYNKNHKEDSKQKMSSSKLKEKNNQYGKHWYSNGIENIMAFECPEGYKAGRIGTFSSKNGVESAREKLRKYKFWNNGIENRYCEICPQGFVRGKLHTKKMEKAHEYRKEETENDQKELVNKILISGIDLTKRGWRNEAIKTLGITRNKINKLRFILNNIPNVYHNAYIIK
jgi:hypothetical protein